MKRLAVCLVIILIFLGLSSCCSSHKTDQDIIAEHIQDQFSDIEQHPIDGKTLSLDDAEAILYCWAFDGNSDQITQEELKEAVAVMLESHEEIHDLIYSIDDINCNDYR